MTIRQKILIGLLGVPAFVLSLGISNKGMGENEDVAITRAEFVEQVIKKERPVWQAGLLNAIGGHVEKGEYPVEAMQREFLEETG